MAWICVVEFPEGRFVALSEDGCILATWPSEADAVEKTADHMLVQAYGCTYEEQVVEHLEVSLAGVWGRDE